MKIQTMRFIDKYAGIPLCVVSSIIKKIFFRSSGKKIPKKVLFIELSEMGSAILADPAMRKCQKDFNAELFFVIFKRNKASLQLLNTVSDKNIFTLNADNIFSLISDTIKFFKWCRNRKIDTVVDLELFSRFTALLSAYCGADNIVGFHNFYGEGLYRGNMLTHKVFYNPHHHISKNFIAMVNCLLEKSDGLPFSKTIVKDEDVKLEKAVIDEETVKKVKEKISSLYKDYENKRIVLINPNASDLLPQRRWSKDKYVTLIKMILEKYEDVLVLITGAIGEKKEAESLLKQIDMDRCINFAGKLHLTELTSLYSISTLMVTNDSGPAHFASVTNMPTIVIFGPETPALYGSLGPSTPIYAGLLCSPCVNAYNHRKTPCKNNVCLKVIDTEEVFKEVVKRLK